MITKISQLIRQAELNGTLEQGDYVDFGVQGSFFVCNPIPNANGLILVSDEISDRYNPQARGYYLQPGFAKRIIQKGDPQRRK